MKKEIVSCSFCGTKRGSIEDIAEERDRLAEDNASLRKICAERPKDGTEFDCFESSNAFNEWIEKIDSIGRGEG